MLKVLIVDDEPLAHEVLLHHLKVHQDFAVVGQCYSAIEALQWLGNHQVDVLFLDINMPQLNGIEMLKVLGNRPQVVIVSAYQDYALQGFDLEVSDYLLKPVSRERFAQSLDKLRRNQPGVVSSEPSSILLKVDRGKHKFLLSEVSAFEAYGNYVKVWRGEACTLANSTLKQILDNLPTEKFTQIHKSFVVNNEQITSVSADCVTMSNGRHFKIGKTFKNVVKTLW